MTDRHAGYIVTLDKDAREDDAQATLDAIRMIRGVGTVIPVVSDPMAAIGQSRAKREIIDKLIAVIEAA